MVGPHKVRYHWVHERAMYKYICQVGLDLAALGDRSSCDGGGGCRKGVLEEPVDLQKRLGF